MALVNDPDPVHLPCGALLDDLIAQVTEGTSPGDRVHQAACEFCQSALESIRQAWEEFQELARTAVAIPEGLADRVVARIRAAARPGGDGVVLHEVGPGATRISAAALNQLARRAALAIGDVVLATVREAGPDPDDPDRVVVSLRLVVALGAPVAQIAADVRGRVIDDLRTWADTTVSRVDIAVEDVVVDDG